MQAALGGPRRFAPPPADTAGYYGFDDEAEDPSTADDVIQRLRSLQHNASISPTARLQEAIVLVDGLEESGACPSCPQEKLAEFEQVRVCVGWAGGVTVCVDGGGSSFAVRTFAES